MPTIICCLIIFTLWLNYERRKSDKCSKQEQEMFWKRERESNLVRKKDLSTLDYITIPYENLPFSKENHPDFSYIEDKLYHLKDKKIVNLSNQSNTDLKLAYGTANLNELSSYDQNYIELIRLLNQWGQLFYKNGDIQNARTVLSYAVSIGSDVSQSFLTLAAIYIDSNDQKSLFELRDRAAQFTNPLKVTLFEKLNTICEKSYHAPE